MQCNKYPWKDCNRCGICSLLATEVPAENKNTILLYFLLTV
jgi:hypothetical protein